MVAPGATYHAVLLTNGEAYYGRLQHLGMPILLLSEVYYVKREPQGSKQTVPAHQARRRVASAGSNAHSTTSVLLIEPVLPDSEIAKAIAEVRRK
jgi:hypothetical protein